VVCRCFALAWARGFLFLTLYWSCFFLVLFRGGCRMENMLQGIERVALQGVDGFVDNDGVEEKEAQKEAQSRETSMSIDSLDGTGDPSLFRWRIVAGIEQH
jgi:hypothetical protein